MTAALKSSLFSIYLFRNLSSYNVFMDSFCVFRLILATNPLITNLVKSSIWFEASTEYKCTVADINLNFVSFQRGLYSLRIPCLNTHFPKLWGRKVILVQGQLERSRAEAKGQEQLLSEEQARVPGEGNFLHLNSLKPKSEGTSRSKGWFVEGSENTGLGLGALVHLGDKL